MGLVLKKYQVDALGALETFFASARGATSESAVATAFDAARREALGEAAPKVPYRPLSHEYPSIPQVCLRIPTGGGKTLLGAHAIERAARLYVGTPAPLALWLVPSNVIRTQTLEALKTPGHPYREALAAAAQSAVTVGKGEDGVQVTVRGVLPQAALDAAIAAAPTREREELTKNLERHQARAHAAVAPSQRGERFAPVPQLCIPVQEEIALMEPDLRKDLAAFSLAGQGGNLAGFSKEETERPYLIDIDRGHTTIKQDDGQYGLDIDLAGEGIRREDVIRELDRRVRRDDLLQADMIAWLGRALDGLVVRGLELTYMARHVNRLAEAIATRLKALEQTRRNEVFQRALFGETGKARLSDHYQFNFDPANYPARWSFDGKYIFNRHFYPLPGELKPEIKGEETACAIEIDSLEEVKFWIRNLERQPMASFWLPTSTDRFYPDFVAQLNDGRILVVEYKGAHLFNGDDSKEKRTIGEVWAAASKGRCRFVMVTDKELAGKSVAAQLRAALA